LEGYLIISQEIQLPLSEVRMKPVRSGGPGGQHVNKVETGIQIQFDINQSSLPEELKEKILKTPDKRISKDGILTLRAQTYRSQEKNKEEAVQRLVEFIRPFTREKKKRLRTKPTKASLEKRKAIKIKRSTIKSLRRKPPEA
jgi:ribosome-associated protein